MQSDGSDFYDTLPILDDFAEAVKIENLSSASRRLGRRFRRRRRLDPGRGARTLQDGQHGRRRRYRRCLQSLWSGGPFLSSSAATARASPSPPPTRTRRRGRSRRWRSSHKPNSRSRCGRRCFRSAISGPPAATCGSRDSALRPIAPTRCSEAAGSPGSKTEAKRGRYALTPAPLGARPDLTGLSCRWSVAPARRGVILSVIVAPRGEDPALRLARRGRSSASAFPPPTPEVRSRSRASASPSRAPRSASKPRPPRPPARPASGRSLAALKGYLMAAAFHRFKLRAGSFDMATFVGDVAANADFRKFDDTLRMTLDCSEAFAGALEARLAAAEEYRGLRHVPPVRLRNSPASCRPTAIAATSTSSTAPTAATPWLRPR